MDEAWAADRILLLSQGRLVADGPPQGVLTQTDLLLKHGLELPFIVRMKQALEQQGLPLSSSIYTREELVGELCRLLRED
jgi:energy-coupling factor transport system ATP-binding protein